MNNRERLMAALRGQSYDHLPIFHFGFWRETLIKWLQDGHLNKTMLECEHLSIQTQGDFDQEYTFRGETYPLWHSAMIVCGEQFGFEGSWGPVVGVPCDLFPSFDIEVLETMPSGHQKIINRDGQIVIVKPDTDSIPAHVGSLLTDRASWEKFYLPKLQFTKDRIDYALIEKYKQHPIENMPMGVNGGSMFGIARNWMGVEGISYLYADDEGLYDEILNTLFELSYKVLKAVFETGIQLDFVHMWEDICFKNGPLVVPRVFEEKTGHHYEQISDLAKQYGVPFVSLDSDGLIDELIPTWFYHGINTMFPIEVGTWGGSIEPMRKKYGPELKGLGGMDKRVFAQDYAAVDREIERLRRLVDLGGYIPFPDHAITPDAKWENVQYYADKMHAIYG